jgi:exodeoxyribonuclease VII small subunit
MAKKSFDKAFKDLQKIVDDLQSGETSIDALSAELKTAKELVQFCKQKLREVEDEISSLDDNGQV